MHRHLRLTTILALAVQALLLAPPASAAKTPAGTHQPREAIYRCRDANGRVYVGQATPAECMDENVEVLDAGGRVVRIIPGREALEDVATQKAADAARVVATNRDRTLLVTYLSVADIERLRDQRLEQLVQQARVTDQYIANLGERETRLVQEVQRFRPYSDKKNAPPLPDHIAEDIVNTVNGLQVYRETLAKNTEEQQRLRSDFDSDIARFKELKGIR